MTPLLLCLTELDDGAMEADVKEASEENKEVASKLPKQVQEIIQVGETRDCLLKCCSVINCVLLFSTAHLRSRSGCSRNG